MKFSSIIAMGLPLLAEVAFGAPTKTFENIAERAQIVKRASITDGPNTGFATQNGGTTGGKGGTTTTVSTLAQFTAAVAGDKAAVVVLTGKLTASIPQVRVGSNKSIIGKDSKACLSGFGLLIKDKKNVIIRNIAISKVVAKNGDALGIQKSTNVWVDHVDLSSDRSHDKDFYDGLLDITHAADFITVSNSYIHDHFKASLIGHSDSNKAEDKGHLRVTYANNFFENLNSRGPSIRFGTGHFFNNFYNSVSDGINTRQGAQVLIESNVFVKSGKPIFSTDGGFAVEKGNDLGGAKNAAPAGTLKAVSYPYSLLGSAKVKKAVVGTAGQTLVF